MKPEGWYLDPFGVHEARWFSDGTPTSLVRDGEMESRDDPPSRSFDGALEPVPESEPDAGEDLLRADEPTTDSRADDGPFEALTQSGGSLT